MEDDKITSTEARRILNCSSSLIGYLIANDKLKPVGKFAGNWILDRRQVEYLARQRERERSR
jgi:hypothetical protein